MESIEPEPSEKESDLMKIVKGLCDCMLDTTRKTCKIFQGVYILILIGLISVTVMYRR